MAIAPRACERDQVDCRGKWDDVRFCIPEIVAHSILHLTLGGNIRSSIALWNGVAQSVKTHALL